MIVRVSDWFFFRNDEYKLNKREQLFVKNVLFRLRADRQRHAICCLINLSAAPAPARIVKGRTYSDFGRRNYP